MAENEKEIFRKSSLERISSPEQLNDYVKITNPSLIAILVAILTILAACGFWIFSSGIPKYMDLVGIAVTSTQGDQRVYCYIPISQAKRLSEGMEVQISPDYAPREEYGYKKGKVIKVGSEIVTPEYLEQSFENPQIVGPLPPGNVVEVQLSMGEWSNDRGEAVEISDGSTCTVSVVIGEQRPYQLIFNS